VFESPESYIAEYAESPHFLFLPAEVKENAEAVLSSFFDRAATHGALSLAQITPGIVELVLLQDMPRLNLPAPMKQGLPDLLDGFFGFLKESGRFPAAGALQMCSEALAGKYRASLREDGSVKGETFRKSSTEVGRNDPCFCGSGKKFKKCCGPLMGA
jgi:hypothetical protein